MGINRLLLWAKALHWKLRSLYFSAQPVQRQLSRLQELLGIDRNFAFCKHVEKSWL
jgi:hypothetical protein